MNENDGELMRIAEAVADGLPIDWNGLQERDPARTVDLERLRAVERVVAAFREVRGAEDPDADSA